VPYLPKHIISLPSNSTKKPVFLAAYFIFLWVIQASVAFTDAYWIGKVVGVTDGDTISVMREGREQIIRLYGIDTPEMGQAFGKKAKKFTSDQVFGRQVKVVPLDRDRYGRIVALVHSINSSEILNEAIVKAGYAWVYVKYCKAKFCSEWYKFEERARDGRLGLWSDSNPIAPWNYRKSQVHNKPETIGNTSKNKVKYHGNSISHTFHRPGCRYYNCKNCTVEFENRNDAISAGYRPCNLCKP